jgi:hypothetical protein
VAKLVLYLNTALELRLKKAMVSPIVAGFRHADHNVARTEYPHFIGEPDGTLVHGHRRVLVHAIQLSESKGAAGQAPNIGRVHCRTCANGRTAVLERVHPDGPFRAS